MGNGELFVENLVDDSNQNVRNPVLIQVNLSSVKFIFNGMFMQKFRLFLKAQKLLSPMLLNF